MPTDSTAGEPPAAEPPPDGSSPGLAPSDEDADENGQQEREEVLLPRHRPSPPWLTFTLVGVNLAFAAAETLLGGMQNVATLIFMGAKVNPLIEAGDYWRLVTANFVHTSGTHLLWNMLGLLIVGRLIEAFYGRPRYLMLYVLTGVAGTLASYEYTPTLSCGASGALFGLLGVLTIHNLRYRRYLHPSIISRLWILPLIIGLQLLTGLLDPRVDIVGHLGGLAAGLVLGMFTERRIAGATQGEREGVPLPAALGTAVLLLAYGLVGLVVNVRVEQPLMQGAVAEARGDEPAAIRWFTLALERQPQLLDIRASRARLLIRQHRWDEVSRQLADLHQRTRGEPASAPAYFLLADLAGQELALQGRFEEAARVYHTALERRPDPEARAQLENNLAFMLADQMKGNLDEAQRLAESALGSDPGNAVFLDTLAWVYFRMGRLPEARRVLEQALPRAGELPEVRYHLGAILEAQGEAPKAIASYREALRLLGDAQTVNDDRVRRQVWAGLKRLTGKDEASPLRATGVA